MNNLILDDCTVFKLGVGDKVEDRREKRYPFNLDKKTTEKYPGYPGVVTEVTNQSFRVQWEPYTDPKDIEANKKLGLGNKGYEMGYAWCYWDEGIRRKDQFE